MPVSHSTGRREGDPTPQGPVRRSCTGQITQAVLKRIQHTSKRFAVRDTTVPGLLLRVGAKSGLSWYLDYRDRAGKRVLYKIGTTLTHNLESAKREARAAIGTDPAAQKRRQREESKKARQEAARGLQRTLRAFIEQPGTARAISRTSAAVRRPRNA